jgi:hypothetical protein
MEKDSQVKLGTTKCDFCDQPATQARGRLVVCDEHTEDAENFVKGASAQGSLKAAPITLSDQHR